MKNNAYLSAGLVSCVIPKPKYYAIHLVGQLNMWPTNGRLFCS